MKNLGANKKRPKVLLRKIKENLGKLKEDKSQKSYSGPSQFSFCFFLALRNSSTVSHLCLVSQYHDRSYRWFHLLGSLLGHLALEHEVLENVRLDDKLERFGGALRSSKPVGVQLLGLRKRVKHCRTLPVTKNAKKNKNKCFCKCNSRNSCDKL